MRVAIDITSAAKPDPTGIGRYAFEMVRAMGSGALAAGEEVRLAIRPQSWGDRRHVAALGRPRLLLPVWPRVLLGKVDVFHAAGASLPRAVRALKVATIPDTNTLDDAGLARERWVSGRVEKIRAVVARADMVFGISSFVRARLLHHFPELGPERVKVTHLGVDHAGLTPEPGPGDAETRARLGVGAGGRPYVLYVGRVERRKNPEGLVRAFARAKAAAGHELVFAGARGVSDVDAALRETALGGRVRFLGRFEDRDIGALYRGAAAFALPSHYEGFGIPLAEALACGTPSLATNVTSLPEVAGDAAVLVDDDVDAIATGLERVLGDAPLRDELRRKGPERARRFTWRACAEGTVAAYREMLRMGPR